MIVKDLVVGYKANAPVAGPINLTVADGEMVLLKGPNGSGKTTFLKTVAGLLKPLSGSIDAPDAPDAVLIPTRIPKVKGFTVTEFIKTFLGFPDSEILVKLNIAELADMDISTLSDGQFQKVCLCPAVASGKKLILLDEPTAFLDADSRLNFMQFLQSLPVAVLFSTHDLAVCEPFCTQVINFQ